MVSPIPVTKKSTLRNPHTNTNMSYEYLRNCCEHNTDTVKSSTGILKMYFNSTDFMI